MLLLLFFALDVALVFLEMVEASLLLDGISLPLLLFNQETAAFRRSSLLGTERTSLTSTFFLL